MLPYAGGNKFAYKCLEERIPAEIEPIAVELPGRGKRFTEPLLTDIVKGIDDIYRQVSPLLGKPYAIFGHSMGAVLGFLLAQKIIGLGLPPPLRLFCSGRSAMWNYPPDPWYSRPAKDFWRLITDLGGLPDPALLNDEMRMLFEPILRADFCMIQRMEANPPLLTRMDVPLSIFLGKQDKLTAGALTWQQHTTRPAHIVWFEGGHFYFLDNAMLVAQQIRLLLNPTTHETA